MVVLKANEKKLKGGALYIAIIIGIIMGILIMMFILLASYNQRYITDYGQHVQLQNNMLSAFDLSRSSYFNENLNGKWNKNNYSDDSTRIKRLNWGAYTLINILTKNRHQSLAQSGLYGVRMNADTGLFVSDRGVPINATGNVVFKSNCYLPKAGVRAAHLDGKGYLGAETNRPFIKISPGTIPELSKEFVEGIKQQQKNMMNSNDSIGSLPAFAEVLFSGRTLVCEINRELSHVHLKNNIKLISNSTVIVDSSSHLNNVLIICKKIKFKSGFKGRVHVIASDSIIVSEKCTFDYPSSFVLSCNEVEKKGKKCILFKEDSHFSGGIVVFCDGSSTGQQVLLKLNATSVIKGLIYSTGFVHAEGELYANVISNALMLKTASALYDNHISECTIDAGRFAHALAIPLIFKNGNKLTKCSNL